jgi:hypothetical protein
VTAGPGSTATGGGASREPAARADGAPVGRPLADRLAEGAGALPSVAVPGVTVVRLPVVTDARGALNFAEYGAQVPFVPLRYFAMLDVPAGKVRGDHAHRACHQFFVCLRGACTLRLDDGRTSGEVLLESPAVGVHAPPLTWATVRLDLPGTVVLTLASDPYDRSDYIVDYDEFLQLVSAP